MFSTQAGDPNPQNADAIKAQLAAYDAKMSGTTLDAKEQTHYNELVTQLDALNKQAQPVTAITVNGNGTHDSIASLLNTKPRTSSRNGDYKDHDTNGSRGSLQDVVIEGNGANGTLEQSLLDKNNRAQSKEVKIAYELINARDYAGLANYLKADAKEATDPDSLYNKLSKDDQQLILDEFALQNKRTNCAIQTAGWSGLFGEGFYIAWDYLARVGVLDWYTKLNPTANYTINALLIPFIFGANAAFDPRKEARDVLEATMLNPENSIKKLIKNNKFLSVAFLTFAFGGSYIEVEKLYDPFEPLGAFKYVAFAAVVGAGINYYGLFNFMDVIKNCRDWYNSPKCEIDPSGADEVIAKIFVETHKLLTVAERVTRIGFGGFKAGEQLSGQNSSLAGYISAGIIGAGTLPVGWATRALATDEIYYKGDKSVFPKCIPGTIYSDHKLKYEMWSSQSWLNRLNCERKLFFSASVWLQVPAVYFAAKLLGSTVSADNPYAQWALRTVGGLGGALAGHFGIFRWPAKRAAIAQNCVEAELKLNPRVKKLNKAGERFSYAANVVDQGSRVLTLGYALNTLFPSVFNIDDWSGVEMLALAESIAMFIAVSAFRYQVKKTDAAYPELLPRLFAAKARRDSFERQEDTVTMSYEPPADPNSRSVVIEEANPTAPSAGPGLIN